MLWKLRRATSSEPLCKNRNGIGSEVNEGARFRCTGMWRMHRGADPVVGALGTYHIVYATRCTEAKNPQSDLYSERIPCIISLVSAMSHDFSIAYLQFVHTGT